MINNDDEYHKTVKMIEQLENIVKVSKICFVNLNDEEREVLIGPTLLFLGNIKEEVSEYKIRKKEDEAREQAKELKERVDEIERNDHQRS